MKENGVELVVVTVASPTKLQEFIAAAESLPAEYLYCDPSLSSYQALEFLSKFGFENGAFQTGTLILRRIAERGREGLKEMSTATKNYTKFSPVGLVSGKAFSTEDLDGVMQLGGAFALQNNKVVFAHRDLGVADHFDIDESLRSLGVMAA
mmetsp:Transcript_3543/g.12455  ORF Transcript_3543/g.12455 Transcript_3543/m.12455 type:complete len:151 (+) Transcript_3543:447-899(+)